MNSYAHAHAHVHLLNKYYRVSSATPLLEQRNPRLRSKYLFLDPQVSGVLTLIKEISFAADRDHQRKPQPCSTDLSSPVPAGISTVQFLHITLSNHCRSEIRKTKKQRNLEFAVRLCLLQMSETARHESLQHVTNNMLMWKRKHS